MLQLKQLYKQGLKYLSVVTSSVLILLQSRIKASDIFRLRTSSGITDNLNSLNRGSANTNVSIHTEQQITEDAQTYIHAPCGIWSQCSSA
jgi:hypothetical protein